MCYLTLPQQKELLCATVHLEDDLHSDLFSLQCAYRSLLFVSDVMNLIYKERKIMNCELERELISVIILQNVHETRKKMKSYGIISLKSLETNVETY